MLNFVSLDRFKNVKINIKENTDKENCAPYIKIQRLQNSFQR